MRLNIVGVVVALTGTGLFASGDTWGNGWMAFAGILTLFAGMFLLLVYKIIMEKEVGDGAQREENTQNPDSSPDTEE